MNFVIAIHHPKLERRDRIREKRKEKKITDWPTLELKNKKRPYWFEKAAQDAGPQIVHRARHTFDTAIDNQMNSV
jgi:hypothetical protein